MKINKELFGKVHQQEETGFFSATDLVKIGNKLRINNDIPFFSAQEWFRQKGTKEFMSALEKKFGVVKTSTRGRNGHIWVHPLLFMDMARAISPEFKIEIYEFLLNNYTEN